MNLETSRRVLVYIMGSWLLIAATIETARAIL